jgi:phage shock protein C
LFDSAYFKKEKEINAMERQRLYRSQNERMIAGVCGGLAQYFNIDPTIVRLIFVLLVLTASTGFWIYVIMWIVVPEEPVGPTPPTEPPGPIDSSF